MFKVNNEDTRTTLVSLLLTLTYFIPCSGVSVVNIEQLNAGWVSLYFHVIQHCFIPGG